MSEFWLGGVLFFVHYNGKHLFWLSTQPNYNDNRLLSISRHFTTYCKFGTAVDGAGCVRDEEDSSPKHWLVGGLSKGLEFVVLVWCTTVTVNPLMSKKW